MNDPSHRLIPKTARVVVSVAGRRPREIHLTKLLSRRIVELWRELPDGVRARCHYPESTLIFLMGDTPICEASICWKCNSIRGTLRTEAFSAGFDAQAAVSQNLLAEIRSILKSSDTDD